MTHKLKNPAVLLFGFFILLIIFVYRSLLFNFSTNLIDWRDYALVVWIINQNIQHISALNFGQFFNTNAFYPHPFALLFSDLFLPQSLLGLPIFALTKNAIITFNFIFFLTLILNYLSGFFLWRQIFKNNYIAFIGSILLSFSPFFHIEFSHFQSQSYWPFIFSLYFLFKNEGKEKYLNYFLSGIFLSIQFLAGVYLSVFLIYTIIIYFLFKIIFQRNILINLKFLAVIFLTFIILDGIFIKGYFDVKNYYSFKRDFGEFVNYSAQLTDYLFPQPINSILYQSEIFKNWNLFDKNLGVKTTFPGFLLVIFSLLGLFGIEKGKQFKVFFLLTFIQVFFIFLLISGFIFSLGPRLSVNGSYTGIPLPYSILLKSSSFLETIRVTERWSFLFYLPLIFFSLSFLDKFKKSKHFNAVLAGTLVLILIEYIPLNLESYKETYINEDYKKISDICNQQKKVLLEIPVTHLDVSGGLVEGLTYMGKMLVSSTNYNCNLVNGYSGYDLPELFNMKNSINPLIEKSDVDGLVAELKRQNINVVKINPEYLPDELKIPAGILLENFDKNHAVERINNTTFLLK